jgi:hypothetical protein
MQVQKSHTILRAHEIKAVSIHSKCFNIKGSLVNQEMQREREADYCAGLQRNMKAEGKITLNLCNFTTCYTFLDKAIS